MFGALVCSVRGMSTVSDEMGDGWGRFRWRSRKWRSLILGCLLMRSGLQNEIMFFVILWIRFEAGG